MGKKRNSAQQESCPCGGSSLADCCGPFISGAQHAASAEQLMRSRYSAYVLGEENYLRETWHKDSRPDETVTDKSLQWLGLEVRQSSQENDAATVEFVARCRVQGRGQRLHEISRFVREDGRWFYVDGNILEK
jgi:SEC-C motif-containing protein